MVATGEFLLYLSPSRDNNNFVFNNRPSSVITIKGIFYMTLKLVPRIMVYLMHEMII